MLLRRFGLRWPRVSRADLLALLRLGLVGHLLHVGLVTYGIHWSTAFSSSLILACGPVFTLLILHWHGLERADARPDRRASAVACVGVLIFLSDKLFGGHWQASGGDLVLLVAASFFSYYTVAAKPLIERHGGVAGDDLRDAARQRAGGAAEPAGRAARVDGANVGPAIWAGSCLRGHASRPSSAGSSGAGSTRCAAWPERAADVPDAAGGRAGGLGG